MERVASEISATEIFEWVSASDVTEALQGLSSTAQHAARAAETRDRALLIHTAVGARLLDERDVLSSRLDIIDDALQNSVSPTQATRADKLQDSDICNIQIGPLTIMLRGLHKVGEITSPSDRKRNIGYLGLRDNIIKILNEDVHNAAMVARYITTPGFWELETGQGDPATSTIYFHPEDNSKLSAQQLDYPSRYPKAVSFNGLTYDKCLEVNGIGPKVAHNVIAVLVAFATEPPNVSH